VLRAPFSIGVLRYTGRTQHFTKVLQDEVYLMNRPWTEAGAAGTLQYRRTELHTGRT